jgi:transposase
MNRKKYASSLSSAQQSELQTLIKTSPDHRVRQRAHVIMLSGRNYSINTLADIFSVHRNTISEWIDAWHQSGVDSLEDAPRSGRPALLNEEQQKVLLEEIDKNPRGLTEAIRAVKKSSGSA